MALKMHNTGIVVDDMPETIAFFSELGLELEGQETFDGEWGGRGRLELSRFLEPAMVGDHRNEAVNTLGYLRVMFEVDDSYVRVPGGLLAGLAEEVS